MRKTALVKDEYYHVYNRGVDKRVVVEDKEDFERFILAINQFNREDSIGSIFQNSFRLKKNASLSTPTTKLVTFVAYNILDNHFHFILRQESDNGISKFMQKLLGGYTRYFNEKHKRSGSLFQGKFKSIHIHDNEYLKHLSAYVNLNHRVHKLSSRSTKYKDASSWDGYIEKREGTVVCEQSVVLDQFSSTKSYEKFALSTLEEIKKRKIMFKDLEEDGIELIKT